MFFESIKLAFRTIRRNVLRSILTLLGIVIGVASVIALVTIGQGATERVTSDLAKLGSNMLIARPGGQTQGPPGGSDARTFRDRDVEAFRTIPNVRALAPSANKTATVTFEGMSAEVSITGTDENFFEVQDWVISSGRSFTETDVRGAAAVCLIGETVRRDLFVSAEAIGAQMRVGTLPCEVIGVLAAKGQSAFGNDQDNTVVMPLRTFHRRVAGNNRISTISVSAATAGDLPAVQAAMTEILRETRRVRINESDDFTVRDMTQIAQALSSTTTVMTGLLSAVATVSLLVGGIGIMNIMMVSVAERTREIGIRLAIGAVASQVLMQFLIESVVLCLIGGTLGIGLGLLLAWVASSLLAVPFTVDVSIVVLAFAFSGLIGILFGFVPARKAARLDPIEALRYE